MVLAFYARLSKISTQVLSGDVYFHKFYSVGLFSAFLVLIESKNAPFFLTNLINLPAIILLHEKMCIKETNKCAKKNMIWLSLTKIIDYKV